MAITLTLSTTDELKAALVSCKERLCRTVPAWVAIAQQSACDPVLYDQLVDAFITANALEPDVWAIIEYDVAEQAAGFDRAIAALA